MNGKPPPEPPEEDQALSLATPRTGASNEQRLVLQTAGSDRAELSHMIGPQKEKPPSNRRSKVEFGCGR